MKSTLTEDQRKALVQYRLERAKATIEEAKFNAGGEYYNTAVNRLYYSGYYAASALMLTFGLEAATHAGIKTMLSLKFIKEGLLDKEYGKTYMTLFENRQSGDYEDFVYCDLSLFNSLLPKTQNFINAIENIIRNK